MVATYNQASRDFDFVPAIGSALVIYRYDALGNPDAGTIFDIETCHLTEIFKNKVTTHSGSNGATLRTRTGADWNFTARLSFPASIPVGLAEAFPEPLLGSMRSVGVTFHVGAPEFWTNRTPAQPVRTLHASKCLLSVIGHTLTSDGLEVAMIDVEGEGNSLLGTYLDGVLAYPQIWLV